MTSTVKQIDSLMKQLGGMNYHAPDISKSMDFSYKAPKFRAIDVGKWDYNQNDFSSTKADKKKVNGITPPNVWDILSGTLGQLGGAVTNQAYNVINDVKGFNDGKGNVFTDIMKTLSDINPASTISQGLINGGKEQWKDWTDPKLTYGDIPLAGFLHGMDKGWKRGDDIMGQFGVNNKWGKLGGGLAIDVALDPLTYLTGGLSLAGKAGKAAEIAKVLEISKVLKGSKAFKDSAEIGKVKNAGQLEEVINNVLGGKAALGKQMAQSEKMAAIAKDLRIPHPVNSMDELLAGAKDVLTKKYPNSANTINRKLATIQEDVAKSGQMYTKAMEKQVADIMNSVKTAHSTAFNSNINKFGASLPFTNKSVTLGNISKKSLNYRTEATIGDKYRHLADDIIAEASKGNTQYAKQLEGAIKERYGVNSIQNLTKTHVEDLQKAMKPFLKNADHAIPDAKITENLVSKEMPNEIYNIKTKKGTPNETITYTKTTADDILKSLEPKVAKKIEPFIKGMEGQGIDAIRNMAPEAVQMFGEFAPKIMKTVKGKTAKEVNDAFSKAADILKQVTHTGSIKKEPAIVYQELQRLVEILKHGNKEAKGLKNAKTFYKDVAKLKDKPFNELSNGRTKFEHFLDKKNPFEARSLHTGDKFLDSMANHIADANSQKIGDAAKYNSALSRIKKFIKKNNIDEQGMKDAIYHLEGKAPASYGDNWQPSSEVKGLADLIRPVTDAIGADEKGSGVLGKLRENYFPHMINKNEEDITAIKEFIDKNGDLNGLKLGNKNDKSRKSFETIAQRDDYMKKIAKDIANATDPEVKAKLEKQLERVANLFDTDVVSALTRRIREGVRSKAMKDMHTELDKFGMMKTNPKEVPIGLEKIKPDVAKKLGLGEGQHYIHPKVLDGLKRTDELFTNQGMKKTIRHLNAITDIFKSLVTTYKIAHYRNNAIGNTIINMAAGVKVSDYSKAAKLITGYRSGKLTPSQMKLMKEAFKHNVMSGGFITDNHFNMHFDDPTKLEKVAKFVGQNELISKVKEKGEMMDDVFRLANYVNGLGKYGGSSRKAAAQVREYLFNYNELTDADRAMRTVVPFWNWTKRNVPLQMKLLLEQPKFAMNIKRFQDIFNDGQDGKDWQKDGGIKVPQWLADRFGADGQGYYTSLPLPTADLKTLTDPLSLLGSMSPWAKIPIEMKMNKQFFTGKPITYGSDTIAAEDIPAYLLKQGGVTSSISDPATGKKSAWESLINYLNPVSQVKQN